MVQNSIACVHPNQVHIRQQETIMNFWRWWAYGIGASFTLCLLFGCAASSGGNSTIPSAENPAGLQMPAPDKIAIFFFRKANYTGGGRIHILKVDNRQIGELTADNYYRLEFWPGEYQFTVFLPSETFFGQTNPSMSISDRVRFGPADTGGVFAYQFTDGMGRRGFERRRLTHPPSFMSARSLGGSFKARETAQVTMFLDTRYDGPAINGQPHGIGTLTWPDGAVYRGVFEHGIATDKARFVFPDERIFMGSYHKGRPNSPGVLTTPDGRILFAGDFVAEKPDGVGLRAGKETPEFCVYDHGRDITKSFRHLARETLDAEDEAQVQAFSRRIDRIGTQIEAANERLFKLKTSETADSVHASEQAAELESSIRELEITRASMERTAATDLKKFVEKLRASRWERELIKVMELKKDHQARVEEERIWCQEEFSLGRRPCGCAPLSSDYLNWQTCEAPVGERQ
jgi:hypothetical protein